MAYVFGPPSMPQQFLCDEAPTVKPEEIQQVSSNFIHVKNATAPTTSSVLTSNYFLPNYQIFI